MIVSGRVQGVGFRYYVEDIALGMNISGWVRNLSDGTVEIDAEGEEDKLKKFLFPDAVFQFHSECFQTGWQGGLDHSRRCCR